MNEAISDSQGVPTTNLAALEDLLAALRDLSQTDAPALAKLMNHAVLICQGRHAVHGGLNLNLQAALASLRQGRSEDAKRFVETALEIQAHWTGMVS